MTFGSSISIQSLYCLYLLSKWPIQLTRAFSVYGASLAHIGGSIPLKNEVPRESRSAFIPISPLRALLRSLIDECILTMSLLILSSSCKSTTYVGDGSSNDFLMLYSSYGSGSLPWISSAILVICSSLLIPPPAPPAEVYMLKISNQRVLPAFV